MNALAYLAINVFRARVTWQDVRLGTYKPRPSPEWPQERGDNAVVLLDQARATFAASRSRRADIGDKSKHLLTVAALSLAFTGNYVPNDSPVGAASIALLFAVILLNMAFFGIRPDMSPCVSQQDMALGAGELRQQLVDDHLRSSSVMNRRTDFLVDLHAAARSILVLGLLGIAFLALTKDHAEQDPGDVVRELRSDSDLVRLLTGPEGPQGEAGPAGRVDYDLAVARLLASTEFQQLVNDAAKTKAVERGGK